MPHNKILRTHTRNYANAFVAFMAQRGQAEQAKDISCAMILYEQKKKKNRCSIRRIHQLHT